MTHGIAPGARPGDDHSTTGTAAGGVSLGMLAAEIAVTLGVGAGAAPVTASRVRRASTLPRVVTDVAAQHGVLGLLPPDDGPAGDLVRAFRDETRARLVRAVADLRVVAAAADRIGAPLVVVKGVALATTVYPRPDMRPFADVDVLTSAEAFGDVLGAIEGQGGRVRTRNWTAMTTLRSSEVTVVMPAGTSVDLHWSLVNGAALRRRFDLSTDTLLASRTPLRDAVSPDVARVDSLDPVAHLGYVCWHLVVSGGVRLVWACDVELAARRLGDAGSSLAHWAEVTRTSLVVPVALDFAAALFPDGAAARLASAFAWSPWRWANARLKRAVVSRPVGRWSGSFLPRATRTSTWDSVAALRPPVTALVGRLAPDQDTLDIMPLERGGAVAREQYLRAVRERRF